MNELNNNALILAEEAINEARNAKVSNKVSHLLRNAATELRDMVTNEDYDFSNTNDDVVAQMHYLRGVQAAFYVQQ